MSAEDREKSRLAYQEKKIKETLLARQMLERQDQQSQLMANLTTDQNSTSSSSTSTNQIAQQLNNIVFDPSTRANSTANKSSSSSSSVTRFSDAPSTTILANANEVLYQGYSSSHENRPRAAPDFSTAFDAVIDPNQSTTTTTTATGETSSSNPKKLSPFELIQEKRRSLPVFAQRDNLLKAVADHQVVVLSSETGSGKTTQIPQFLLEAGYSKVVCTQPRVLAATSVAERVAQEMGVACGAKVGYKVRFDSRVTDRTQLMFCTDGMLLKEVMTDPLLSDYGAIMIDEAHERSVNTDLLLGLIRDLIRERKELRIIVASATLVGEKFMNFFGQDTCTRFEIPGRTFPVKSFFATEPQEDYVEAAAQAVMETHKHQDFPGDILVFLTGQDDIERVEEKLHEMMKMLSAAAIRELVVLPLYSALPMEKQREIYRPRPGARKVILATNVAETSITIDGIVYVIDSGLCKQKFYDPRTRTEALAVVPISKAAALQRKGRAGRTQSGECIRLYTKQMFQIELDPDPAPEILRTSLTSVVLTLKSLGVHNFAEFDFVDPPAPDAIAEAMKTLLLLGAVTSTGQLCKTGRLMAELPLEPSLSKVLLHAQNELNCGKQAAAVVAILSLQNSLFFIPKDKREAADSALGRFFKGTCGDITGYYQVFAAWESERCSRDWAKAHFLNYISAKRTQEIRNQLVNTVLSVTAKEALTSDLGGIQAGESSLYKLDDCLTKSFLAGFFMNASLLSPDMVRFTLVKSTAEDGMIHPSSCFSQVMSRKRKEQQEKFESKHQQQQQQVFDDDENGNSSAAKFRFCDPDTGKPPLIVFGEMRCTPKPMLNHIVAVKEEWVKEAAPMGYFKQSELNGGVMISAAAKEDERRRQREF